MPSGGFKIELKSSYQPAGRELWGGESRQRPAYGLGRSLVDGGYWPLSLSPSTCLPFAPSLLNVAPSISFSCCPLVGLSMQLVYANLHTHKKKKFYIPLPYILKLNTEHFLFFLKTPIQFFYLAMIPG